MKQQQQHGRRRLGAVIAAGAAMSLLVAAPAAANHGEWTANPGTSVADGAIVMDTTDEALTPAGTSYENADLGVEIAPGDVIAFDYELDGAVCGGGQPRLFVEVDGTYVNTFDGNDQGDCGELTDGLGTSTSGTVLFTYEGEVGTIGHAGIVFDNISDRGVATISFVEIGDHELDLTDDGDDGDEDPTTKDDCKRGGWEDYGFRNQGQCIKFVNTGKDSR
ncbi:MAG TPA: hypothetical protein VK906_12795 [Egicoccus sp.]|nr:hypothetical protein [Egicoccus sp.]HSK24054.1 hypothetical protein [Egicoccus sp.]